MLPLRSVPQGRIRRTKRAKEIEDARGAGGAAV